MKVKRMIKSDVDTFKVGDIIKVKLTDGVKVQAMAMQQEEDGMIFCLVDCLPGEYPMNSTRTNEGGYGNQGFYEYGCCHGTGGLEYHLPEF